MISAHELKEQVLTKSTFLRRNWQSDCILCRCVAAAAITGAVFLGPQALPAQHTPPTTQEVAAFAERSHSKAKTGKQVPVPREISDELNAGDSTDDPGCKPDDSNDLLAYQIPLGANPRDLAIQGRGGCFCSPTGNCAFWIYQFKNGRYQQILSTSMVQVFGFLKSTTHGYPDLVAWSHGSATESGGALLRFDGAAYRQSGGWDEEYEPLDAKDRVVKLAKPHVTPYFSDNDQLPQEPKR